MPVRIIGVSLALVILGLAGCGVLGTLTGDPVAPLMRADGWRDELGPPLSGPSAILEVAYDAQTAEQAWADNVPEGLPQRTGDPDEPGIYGQLADVDFDSQALVVWSAGGSSSCPPWVVDIDVEATGSVVIEVSDGAGLGAACTDDYSPYRMLLAVERDRLPAAEGLPTEDVTTDAPPPGGLVAEYPAEP